MKFLTRLYKFQKLRWLCKNYTQKRFADIVKLFIDLHPGGEYLLAAEFESAVSAPGRWASRISAPMPRTSKQVSDYILSFIDSKRDGL